jgi:hypothetical protein
MKHLATKIPEEQDMESDSGRRVFLEPLGQ